ncbi:beta-N-acetylglucosaminidase domain-containing protein [Pacificimonas pallii]|uniref:beta-N-acetylglucosaminidase domain-containing protein n=1 Tax=Pacificimonas pallii TaxID=2827236 RepID=UPI0034E206F2
MEGYFGTPWSWGDRAHVMRTLAPYGYGSFLYAPKADAYLRRDWARDHPAEEAADIRTFAAACRDAGVRFGIGLSPFELHLDWTPKGRAQLRRQVETLSAFGLDDFAILFDDMKGDIPDLAEIQADIVSEAAKATDAKFLTCPSYYSDDPVLDRAFGRRPDAYLETLAGLLPNCVEIFWTGPEVCSREYTLGHIARVTRQLGREPTLWDNYPVNDGPRMSAHLHLRGMTGRGALTGQVQRHFINPALQPHLSLLPAATLAAAYRQGADYDYLTEMRTAAQALYPGPLAEALLSDVLSLQDAGIERVNREGLTRKYAAFDHPAAREVIAFLGGGYRMTAEEVQTQ